MTLASAFSATFRRGSGRSAAAVRTRPSGGLALPRPPPSEPCACRCWRDLYHQAGTLRDQLQQEADLDLRSIRHSEGSPGRDRSRLGFTSSQPWRERTSLYGSAASTTAAGAAARVGGGASSRCAARILRGAIAATASSTSASAKASSESIPIVVLDFSKPKFIGGHAPRGRYSTRHARSNLSTMPPLADFICAIRHPFGEKPAPAPMATCPVCQRTSHPLDSVDFNKNCEEARGLKLPDSGVLIHYYLCDHCGFCFAPAFRSWTFRDVSNSGSTTTTMKRSTPTTS